MVQDTLAITVVFPWIIFLFPTLQPRVSTSKASKLCPKILDILKKSVALGYFLDFLKDINQKHYLDFWLEAETFRLVATQNQKRIRTISKRSNLSNTSLSNSLEVDKSSLCVC